jgi:hypothetical protein
MEHALLREVVAAKASNAQHLETQEFHVPHTGTWRVDLEDHELRLVAQEHRALMQ